MPCVGLLVKFKGKPDAGNPPVRFDEGEGYPSLLYWLKKLITLTVCNKKFENLEPQNP